MRRFLAITDDRAIDEADDARRVGPGQPFVVSDQQDRLTASVQVGEDRHHLLAGMGIERACRLVGKQKGRVVDQGSCNRNALALTATEAEPANCTKPMFIG